MFAGSATLTTEIPVLYINKPANLKSIETHIEGVAVTKVTLFGGARARATESVW